LSRTEENIPTFDYRRVSTVDEAVGLLAERPGSARPLAGGTDLLVQLRAERFRLELVVDTKAVPELSELRFNPEEGLVLGAAVPCCRVYEHLELRNAYPGLVDAASIVGGIAIQGRATVGGNLCNASPSADTVPALISLGATAEITGAGGTRTVPVAEFCTEPGQSVLQPGELLVSLRLPPSPKRSGSAYLRFIPRNEMDIAVAGVGAWVSLDAEGRTILDARVALGAVGPTPIVVEAVRDAVVGTDGSEDALEAAAEVARQAARPISDMRGSAEQRRHLVGVLTKRALRGALARARGDAA
jgi:CO/xanthine dehydrogenase FAD-binding subunit